MNYSRLRVLIANPDVAALSRIGCLFTSRGYEVELAGRATDALTILRDQSPQLLIVDEHLRWGGCDGLLAVLSEAQCLHYIRVIITRDGRPLHEAPLLPSTARSLATSEFVWEPNDIPWHSAHGYDVFA